VLCVFLGGVGASTTLGSTWVETRCRRELGPAHVSSPGRGRGRCGIYAALQKFCISSVLNRDMYPEAPFAALDPLILSSEMMSPQQVQPAWPPHPA
jgi:hypothetical protein